MVKILILFSVIGSALITFSLCRISSICTRKEEINKFKLREQLDNCTEWFGNKDIVTIMVSQKVDKLINEQMMAKLQVKNSGEY